MTAAAHKKARPWGKGREGVARGRSHQARPLLATVNTFAGEAPRRQIDGPGGPKEAHQTFERPRSGRKAPTPSDHYAVITNFRLPNGATTTLYNVDAEEKDEQPAVAFTSGPIRFAGGKDETGSTPVRSPVWGLDHNG